MAAEAAASQNFQHLKTSSAIDIAATAMLGYL